MNGRLGCTEQISIPPLPPCPLYPRQLIVVCKVTKDNSTQSPPHNSSSRSGGDATTFDKPSVEWVPRKGHDLLVCNFTDFTWENVTLPNGVDSRSLPSPLLHRLSSPVVFEHSPVRPIVSADLLLGQKTLGPVHHLWIRREYILQRAKEK